MLHKETVTPETLELISNLQNDPLFEGFILVGGTALSLHIGHRISVDIDLFSLTDFDSQYLLEQLEKKYDFSLQFMHKNTLKGFIRGIFIDLLSHPYPLVQDPIVIDGITLASMADIAAMKINAISGSGTRAKDFIDIYFLLNDFSLEELLGFYAKKYSQRNTFHALKSITYFEDMDAAAWPNMVRKKELNAKQLKKELILKSKDYLLSIK